ncbi:MAG: iron-containing alcohol dehydrogenase family protein [Eubacteriales bacterium]|nr:iron-containing alcohol dehydrogenase family protein [Eubacteriales bacterium]
MNFYMPVKVYCENNCVRAHAKELASFGKKALIVTGRSSAFKNGSIRDVEEALSAHGAEWALFNEVEENPSVETVMKGRDRGLAEGADFVIGIGGGSPMDAAKAIALMIRQKDAGVEYLYDKDAVTDALPVVCIPTTCGTGSEVTAVSVLTRHNLRAKGSIPHKIFPELALLDGKYLLSAPRSVIADTSIDALCHMIESWLNTKATDCSRMCVDAGLRVWARTRRVILSGQPLTAENCSDMLLASMFAGMAIAHTGTTLPHGLSYPLTYETGMPHGKACGYFLPGYLREADPDAVSYLLETAGFTDVDSLESYYQHTCGRDEVPGAVLAQSVDATLASPAKLAQCPFHVDEAVLCRIAGLQK